MANMFQLITRNISKKPATRLYPNVVREPFERTRGQLVFNEDPCIYCGICQRQCPADAIKVDRANTTWELNSFRCIICGECVQKCPKKCLSLSNQRRLPGVEREHIKNVRPPKPQEAEAKPAEAKPVEAAKPAEVKPAETKAE